MNKGLLQHLDFRVGASKEKIQEVEKYLVLSYSGEMNPLPSVILKRREWQRHLRKGFVKESKYRFLMVR
jgi:hypothetical protein